MTREDIQARLRNLPAIDKLIAAAEENEQFRAYPRQLTVDSLRESVDDIRGRLRCGEEIGSTPEAVLALALNKIQHLLEPSLRRVVNATGVVLHTNLGRATLGSRARAAVQEVMAGYSNLEYDVAAGERGSRYSHIAKKICQLTGAEEALVVNNNAAAVMLVLSTMAKGREVIVSRGQLVEIGGSFRVPDVLKQSGATLVEVGTTNKTHLSDYAQAITPNTAAILKVHTSNYRIVGFTSQPADEELTSLGAEYGLPVIEDLGSGTLLPVAVAGWSEPTVTEQLAAGMDVVTFSGDKLLGAGQAGIIAGKSAYLSKMKKNPLLRAMRIDKLSLAALEGTLLDYIAGEPRQDIPGIRMIEASAEELRDKARALETVLRAALAGWDIAILPVKSQTGGGALPALDLEGWGVAMSAPGVSAAQLEERLRRRRIPIIVRVQDQHVVMDVRCLYPEDTEDIVTACREAVRKDGRPS